MRINKLKYIIFILFLFLNGYGLTAFQAESNIVKIEGNNIYVNWGSNDGIRAGMVFSAYRGIGVRHPTTSEEFEIEKELVGNIKITEVFPEYSIGKMVSKRIEPRIGDYLELIINSGGEEDILSLSLMDNKKGLILSIDEGIVNVNVGEDDGIQAGLLFDVVREVILKHPVTGENLERKKYLVGKISVESVKKGMSVCDILSGWEDIKVGDEVVLSERQRSDMGIDVLGREKELVSELSEKELEKLLLSPEKLIEQKFFGKILKINSETNTAVFSWEEGFNKSIISQGNNLGIYRKERVIHPITKVEIGIPEILIGEGSFIRIIGNNGELRILNTEAQIKKGDIVGLVEERPSEMPESRRTAETTIGKRIDLRKEAETLTQDVIRIQDDLDRLRAMSDRIRNIEKSIASQKVVTSALKKDISDIKEKLSFIAESGGISLIPPQTTMELYGAHPEKAKSFRIKYTDDIDVKFQFRDRTLLVSLDVDSAKVKSKMSADKYAPLSEKEFESETDEYGEIYDFSELGLGETMKKEKPFYIKYMTYIIGAIAALILLFAVFSLVKKKEVKKKPPAEEEIEFGEEEEEEELEEIEEEEESLE
ncbi:MAG: hypothetical protein A7315_03105 [Candidatus Altiarchaeales archaeon WOR_SM1_79]|nr:MAG: hypothetical protein A7315_03105 [Candidatus Altiarchaeales archaeon WOR_SM1_79]